MCMDVMLTTFLSALTQFSRFFTLKGNSNTDMKNNISNNKTYNLFVNATVQVSTLKLQLEHKILESDLIILDRIRVLLE